MKLEELRESFRRERPKPIRKADSPDHFEGDEWSGLRGLFDRLENDRIAPGDESVVRPIRVALRKHLRVRYFFAFSPRFDYAERRALDPSLNYLYAFNTDSPAGRVIVRLARGRFSVRSVDAKWSFGGEL